MVIRIDRRALRKHAVQAPLLREGETAVRALSHMPFDRRTLTTHGAVVPVMNGAQTGKGLTDI